jgi:hypothetical protein
MNNSDEFKQVKVNQGHENMSFEIIDTSLNSDIEKKKSKSVTFDLNVSTFQLEVVNSDQKNDTQCEEIEEDELEDQSHLVKFINFIKSYFLSIINQVEILIL